MVKLPPPPAPGDPGDQVNPIDPETGVWNLVWVYDRAHAEWNRTSRNRRLIAGIELEVLRPSDGAAMKAVAEVLRDKLRCYDLIGRKGPTTFAVVACEIEPRSARKICERIKSGVDDRAIEVAFGAVTNEAERVEMVEDLFDVAWEACARARKGEGADGICVVE